MLNNGMIDAAMLPEPYATWAALEGHKRISRSKPNSICNALWITAFREENNNPHEAQAKTFARVYREAIERMASDAQADTLRAILTSEYGLPPLLTDTIQLPPMPKPRAVNEQEMDSVAAWLREQNRLPKEYSTQKFLTRQIK